MTGRSTDLLDAPFAAPIAAIPGASTPSPRRRRRAPNRRAPSRRSRCRPAPNRRPRRRGGAWVFWLALAVVIAVLVAAALIGRRQVVARFPQTAPVYAFLGLPV